MAATLVRGVKGGDAWPLARPRVRWPQETLNAAIKRLFPTHWLQGVQMPFIEDVVNSEPFTTYAGYLEQRGIFGSSPQGLTMQRTSPEDGGMRLTTYTSAGHLAGRLSTT